MSISITGYKPLVTTTEESSQSNPSLPVDIFSHTFKIFGDSYHDIMNKVNDIKFADVTKITNADFALAKSLGSELKSIVKTCMSFALTCTDFLRIATSNDARVALLEKYKSLVPGPKKPAGKQVNNDQHKTGICCIPLNPFKLFSCIKK